MFIIEITTQGDALICSMEGGSVEGLDFEQDILDCVGSGDCGPACNYVRDCLEPEFRIVAKDYTGKYKNRLATPKEKQEACESIYFESDLDFSDESLAETFIIWQAASNFEYETTEQE